MRSLRLVFVGIFTFLLTTIGGCEITWVIDGYRLVRVSPLAASLPRSDYESSVEFRRRIDERFPIGSSESELVQVLRNQGFRETSNLGGLVGRRMTMTAQRMDLELKLKERLVCEPIWFIHWTADAAGRLLTIAGIYSRSCDGFRMPAQHGPRRAHDRAGVRKPPGNGVAGSWAPGSAGAMGISSAPMVQRARVDAALDLASGALVGECVAERPERCAIVVAERTLSTLLLKFWTCLLVAGGEPASKSIGCYG